MSGLAPPHERAEAETTTAEALQTLRPAGYPAGGWLVSVDTTHFEPLNGSEDACVRSLFQARFRLGRVHSQRGRGL